MVYFIRVKNDGPIKIGYTVNPQHRLKVIQGCNHEKLELLASIPGDHSLENKIHRDLAHSNIHGEWFSPTAEVLRYIQEIQTPEYESEDNHSWAILWRDTEKSKTDHCPFCGKRHIHGIGDGHRVAHCMHGVDTIHAKDGTILHKDKGYIVRTRTKQFV